MKVVRFLPLILAVACTTETPPATETTMVPPAATHTEEPKSAETGILTYCWQGNLEGPVPVQLQYQVEGDVVTGSIHYLATKNKVPIPLIGTVENNEFRLLEFTAGGTITGIISGKRAGEKLVGDWYSPTTRKIRKMDLSGIDTLIPTHTTAALKDQISGRYHYSYGEEGPQGTLTLKPLAAGKALLEISAVTSAPAYNIAEIEADTVTLEGDRLVYRFPNAPECSFQVRFYKNFAQVNYLTNDGCTSQFGHNASVEGTFLKQK